jgi:1-acyl-sn-glycerol-3-phosphate acyltransferase
MSTLSPPAKNLAATLAGGEDAYRTPPQRVGWFSRLFPSIAFFLRCSGIVFGAAAQAKRQRYDGPAWAESSVAVLHALEKSGVEFEITGLEHLRAVEGPCLIIGNHMGTLETMILPGIIQPLREVTFVVKRALVEYPVFKHVMRSRDPIAVSQTDPRGDFKLMMTGGQARLEKGISLVVFPQGQRALHFDPKTFNSIGVKLASRAAVPIVPVALKTDAWGLGAIVSDFGAIDPQKKVHFAFAPPLMVEGRGAEENQQIIQFIQTKLQAWEA